MNVIIRKGVPSDIPQVLALIRELAVYEKAEGEVTNTESDMLRDGFGDEPVFRLLVAEMDQTIVGMAIYFIKYSTWKGKGVYLDDIVVNERHRGWGIGSLLFDAVVNDSRDLGAKQLHWQVLDWNEPAIHFYRKYKADFDGEWINCKLNENQISNFKRTS
jgi:GNAT superfamily N-acetyltransferase